MSSLTVTLEIRIKSDGKRVEKSNGTLYWYGPDGNVLDETTLSGSVTNEYVYLNGSRIARLDSSGNAYYYVADQLGTSRVIAEVPSGSTTATLCYDADFYPFGGERAYTNTCSQNYKFTAKERDAESGLDYFGARHYSSQFGRFMQPDPSGVAFSNPANPQSWNLYSYVMNNPLNAVDPDGRQCVWDDGSYDSADDPDTGSVGQCTNAGGTYFDPSTFHENASLQGSNDDWSASSNSFLAGQVAEVQALQDSPPTMPGADQATWWNTFTSGMTTTINFGGSSWFTSQVSTGTHPFRDNNPGDIENGLFTSSNGAIGADGRFAVFPTVGTGNNALGSLLSGPAYSNLTLNQAVSQYAPAFENNTAGYQQFLMNVVGVSGNTPLSSLSPSQFSALENGIARYEGFNAAGNSSVTVTSVVNVP